MSVTITIRDESAVGKISHERELEFPEEQMTVRELIRERVYQEVQDFNRNAQQKTFQGLVQPSDTERVLNNSQPAFQLREHRQLDWKAQYQEACEAFDRNGFLILVGEQQASRLEEKFKLRSGTSVSFVKLTPLVGG